MEKRKPSFILSDVQKAAGSMTIAKSALLGAAEMGLTRRDIEHVIGALTSRDFYKSMTSDKNPRIWMDVYHGHTDEYVIYIKFVEDAVTEFACISFKEK